MHNNKPQPHKHMSDPYLPLEALDFCEEVDNQENRNERILLGLTERIFLPPDNATRTSSSIPI